MVIWVWYAPSVDLEGSPGIVNLDVFKEYLHHTPHVIRKLSSDGFIALKKLTEGPQQEARRTDMWLAVVLHQFLYKLVPLHQSRRTTAEKILLLSFCILLSLHFSFHNDMRNMFLLQSFQKFLGVQSSVDLLLCLRYLLRTDTCSMWTFHSRALRASIISSLLRRSCPCSPNFFRIQSQGWYSKQALVSWHFCGSQRNRATLESIYWVVTLGNDVLCFSFRWKKKIRKSTRLLAYYSTAW